METITNQSRTTDLPLQRPARVVEEFEQPRYSRRDTLLTMFGVLMVMLLGSLDQTIVATALPHVIADLHGFDQYTWVSTAYLLTSTVTVPIYGLPLPVCSSALAAHCCCCAWMSTLATPMSCWPCSCSVWAWALACRCTP